MPKSADSWGRPVGSDSDRRLVWTGTVVVLLGAVLIGTAVVVQLLWLGIVAAVLAVVGAVLLAVGRPRSTSRVPR